jgi:hypothetical protein
MREREISIEPTHPDLQHFMLHIREPGLNIRQSPSIPPRVKKEIYFKRE